METRNRILFIALALLALSTFNTQLSTAFAQGTTVFTYQGQLRDGSTNANGSYTMVFKLYDAVTNGNEIGGAITNNPTVVNGIFTVNLDFGAGAFDGTPRWVDITVNGVVLTPRNQIFDHTVCPVCHDTGRPPRSARAAGTDGVYGSDRYPRTNWPARPARSGRATGTSGSCRSNRPARPDWTSRAAGTAGFPWDSGTARHQRG